MSEQQNPSGLDGPDFKTVENEVIAAEEKFIPIFDHPVFSTIGHERLAGIRDVIRTIQILEKDDYLKALIANYPDFDEKERQEFFEKKLKNQFISYIPTQNETENSRIVLNYEAFRRNPLELIFIFENIAKKIAQDISYKGEPLDLLTCVRSEILVRQLPPTTIEPLRTFVYAMHDNGLDLSEYMLKQVGFGTLLVNKTNPEVIKLDDALEDIRSDILRTLIESLMYCDPNAEPNSFEQLISGINNLELHILKIGKEGKALYQREHFCIEFLLKYITKSDKASTIFFTDSEAEIAMMDLKELVGMLAGLKARDFTNFLAQHPVKEKAFSEMNKKYATIVWPEEDAVFGKDEG
jgi:hypothetical protein